MKNHQSIQLTILIAALLATLVWLLSITNTAIFAIRDLVPCHPRNLIHNIAGQSSIRLVQHQEDAGVEGPQNVLMPPYTGRPGDDDDGDHNNNNPTSNLIISDIIAKTRQVSIFGTLTRDFDTVSKRLNDKTVNTTVLAPLNSAINALPRKPWEDPEDYERFGKVEAYKGQSGEERARKNLQRFVEAHLVPVSPWKEGVEVETVGGGKLSWTKNGDKIFVCYAVTPITWDVLILCPRFSQGMSKSIALHHKCPTATFGS
jgi:hypothetical protein